MKFLLMAIMLLTVLVTDSDAARRRRYNRYVAPQRCVNGNCQTQPQTILSVVPLPQVAPAPAPAAKKTVPAPPPATKAAPAPTAVHPDQVRCQQEANLMASRGIRGHVGGVIGRFEGVGWSSGGGMPSTCTPSYRMTLTGDAIARSQYGTFRVRSWR
jgi:hypothetical protein